MRADPVFAALGTVSCSKGSLRLPTVIDFRIYRAAFLPALVAVVVLLFALQVPPTRSRRSVAPAEFDQDAAPPRSRARSSTRRPTARPGATGDARDRRHGREALQERRRRPGRRAALRPAASTARTSQLRNLILTLPGESPRSVVVLASRDSASGPGAASSAAATATLLELVERAADRQAHEDARLRLDRRRQRRRARRPRVRRALPAARPDRRRDRAVAARLGHPTPALAARHLGRIRRAPRPGSCEPPQRALTEQTGAQAAARGPVRGARAAGAAQRARRPGRADRSTASTRSACRRRASGRCRWPRTSPTTSRPRPSGTSGAPPCCWRPRSTPRRAPGARPDRLREPVGKPRPGLGARPAGADPVLPAALASLDGLRPRDAAPRRGSAGRSGGRPPGGCRSLAALLLLYLLAVTRDRGPPDLPLRPRPLRGSAPGEIVVMALLAAIVPRPATTRSGAGESPRGWRRTRPRRRWALISVAGRAGRLAGQPVPGAAARADRARLAARRPPRARLPWPAVAVGARSPLAPAGRRRRRPRRWTARAWGPRAPWQLLLMVGDGQIGFGTMLALCLLVGSLVGTHRARRSASRGRRAGSRLAPAGSNPARARSRGRLLPLPATIWTHLLSRPRRADDLGRRKHERRKTG